MGVIFAGKQVRNPYFRDSARIADTIHRMGTTEDSFRTALGKTFARAVPHAKELGILVEEVTADGTLGVLPYREDWLGDTQRGIIHTGLITTFVDSICGIALLGHLGSFEAIATLDLRMDYLRPSLRDKPLYCHAQCYRRSEHIAFVRASVWQDDRNELVAQSQSVFMLGSHSARRAAKIA